MASANHHDIEAEIDRALKSLIGSALTVSDERGHGLVSIKLSEAIDALDAAKKPSR